MKMWHKLLPMIEADTPAPTSMGSSPLLRSRRSRLPARSTHIPSIRLCWMTATRMSGSSAEAMPVDLLMMGTCLLSMMALFW